MSASAEPDSAAVYRHSTRRKTFPQELIDWVIDFLHDDMKALAACSLVHRRWGNASSLHMFSNFYWPPCRYHWYQSHGWYLFYSCTCSHLLDYSESLEGIRALLLWSPRISGNIREMYISMAMEYNVPRFIPRETSPQEIVDIVDAIPNITTLELKHLRFRNRALPYLSVEQSPSRCLAELRVVGSPSQPLNLEDFYNFLFRFREISVLSCENLQLYDGPSRSPANDMPLPGLLGHIGARFPGLIGHTPASQGPPGPDSPMLQPPSEPTSIESFKLLQNDLTATRLLLDRVCAHLDVTSLTTLLV
ncbi:hypothetical protein PsYK624_098900 [Phanerochaete sordida]|uniref:F-box domain-containing protein n=1 Tax=Phanerochaete sordida TaxID=48140 RepID=A0A9P3LGK6_9APHY|nr:hypothetical protein PsYK624_098900 [Phanerochaete sordida]